MASSEQCIDLEQEFEKNPNLKREDLKMLRNFVESQYPPTSDLLLFLLLHSCYYDMEVAKTTIDCYHKIRSKWPEVFKNRNPNISPFRDSLSISVTWHLKQSTDEGYRMFYSRITDNDPTKYDTEEQIKQFLIVFEYWFNIMGNANGVVVIFDSKELTWGHLPKISINVVRKFLEYVQEGFPIRLKAVHYINTGVILEKMLNIAKMFMKKELHDMIHVHSDLDSLYKYVPKSVLPKDYGGDDVSIQELHEDMLNTLLKNAELFQEDDIEFEEPSKREKFSYIDAF